MPNLRLFTSNRLEKLADALAGVLGVPLSSPFDPEVIVVQSRGMERWISMELARRQGVCANVQFPFPNTFIYNALQKAFPDISAETPFDPRILTWRIMEILPSLITKPGFESILSYLEDREGGLRLYQLSERVADLFDQYLLFRPEMMLGWDRGKENHWQAVLWRKLLKGYEAQHRAALGKAFIERLENAEIQLPNFPERVSVFGISSLPEFHLHVLKALSGFTQVNLFLMNPCREYWGDIVSDWEIEKATGKGQLNLFEKANLHLEKGNSLLASTGKLGGDFFDLINKFDYEDKPLFEGPGEDSLLSCIQSDILDLSERGNGPEGKKTISDGDFSIQIHSCHSPMREVEVLHDHLLKMFEDEPNIRPRDIVVMAPDIEAYAPYIQAVFDAPTQDSARIPFSIADQSLKVEGRIIEPFLAITRLMDGRYSSLKIMTILESRAVQQKFGLSEADVALIRDWVEDTRIRWGIDRANRREMGLPDLLENTWKAGLDRLLLGYAMQGEQADMFADVLPFDNMEGSDTTVLGHFLEFTHDLFSSSKAFDQLHTLDEWSALLKDLLDRFFLPDEATEPEARMIRGTLNDLAEEGSLSNFNIPVDIRVIRCFLEQRFKKEGFGFGFISGGVTFCSMLPMRSIPFEVICLIGMNSDAYPRQSKPLGFDLMARKPRKGDRSRRNDDRYLFLEALLSTRHRLYISYVGQSIRDNTLIPPSVLVSELLDTIEQGFEIKNKDVLKHLVFKHRLQPFSPEYFKSNNSLFSYSRENFHAAECLVKTREQPGPFMAAGLSEPGEEWKTVSVDDLSAFFVNPAKFILNRRLMIYLGEGVGRLQETEPFKIAGLDRYLLAQELVEQCLRGNDAKDPFRLNKATGMLPHGAVGICQYERLGRETKAFAGKTSAHIHSGMLAPLDVDLTLSGFRLTGRIDDLYPEKMIQYRYAKIKAKDRIRTWVRHLVLNCYHLPDYPRNSMVAGMDKLWTAWEYRPVENAEEILAKLLERYWEGLMKPLPFFPESSWEYVEQNLEKHKSPGDALQKARGIWAGNPFLDGEGEDRHYDLCFKNSNPLDAVFEEVSLEVFGPVLECQSKVEA